MRWNARSWSALQISSARATYIFHVVRWQTVQNQRQKRMQSAMDWPQALSFMQPLVDCPNLMKCSVSAGHIAGKLQVLAPQLQCRCAAQVLLCRFTWPCMCLFGLPMGGQKLNKQLSRARCAAQFQHLHGLPCHHVSTLSFTAPLQQACQHVQELCRHC